MADRDEVADGTFGGSRPVWLGRLDKVRNVVRQEMIARQLDRHLRTPPARILDVGAGQGTQSLRLARAGYQVLAVEPDPDMRAAFSAALDAERAEVRDRVTLRAGVASGLSPVTGGATYDAVLLLGVLMYLPASEPVIAELAAHVAPGGFLALAAFAGRLARGAHEHGGRLRPGAGELVRRADRRRHGGTRPSAAV